MTYSLIMRIQVKDFDTWLNRDIDGFTQMMKGQGVKSTSLHRSQEDRNSLVACMKFADEATLHAFVAWYKGAKVEWVKQFPGTEHEILEWFVSEDVESHILTL